MDRLGHLHHSHYHEFFEEPRVALLRSISSQHGGAYVLRHVEVDYLREVRFDDGFVDVMATVTDLGERSLTMHHEMVLPSGALAATNHAVLVAWDLRLRVARRLSDAERSALLRGGQ